MRKSFRVKDLNWKLAPITTPGSAIMGRLVKLELENFKSYQGTQIIGPFDEFTSIIGPNGSGKSNLMDAISFVLGVNSSQLRSNHLVDLINRKSGDERIGKAPGTKRKATKERGALRTVISAFYQPNDGNEVVFSRSVNSAGVSEYKINGKVSSYEDYNAALEKENILVKAKNFLVFQGDVEAIASKSPKELTKLIEQISGSEELKEEYEKLKNLQEKALEVSTFAFNKKRSLNSEIKAVQEQKDDAVKYEQLLLEKIDLISEQVLWKLFHVEQAAKNYNESIDTLTRECEDLQSVIEKSEQDIKEAKKSQAKIQKELLGVEKKLKKAQVDLDQNAPDSLVVEEKFRYLADKIKTLSTNREKKIQAAEKHKEEIKLVENEMELIQNAADQFEKTASNKLAQNELSPELLLEYNGLKEKVMSVTGKERLKLENLERKITPSLANKKQKMEKLEEISLTQRQLEFQREPINAKIVEIKTELDEAESERSRIRKILNKNVADRNKLGQSELEINDNLRKILEKLLQAKIDKQESEKEIKSRFTVESLKRMFPGVHGRLVDLCQPTNKKYEQSLGIVLGKNLDSIVVDQERTAIDCIQYLRQQRSGHATFIPLDTIQVKPVPEKFRTFFAGARPAIDVIQFESTFVRAFQYACGSTLICDSLSVARHICYEKDQKVKAVTLDGTVIHKNGLLTGGISQLHNSYQRWEEKEVAKMKSERDQLLSKLDEVTKKLKGLESDQKLQANLAELDDQIGNLNKELEAGKMDLKSIDDQSKILSGQSLKISEEIATIERSTEKSQIEIESLKDSISAVEEKLFREFCVKSGIPSIRDYEQSRSVLIREYTDKKTKFSSTIAKFSNQLDYFMRQVEEAQKLINEYDEKIEADEKVFKEIEAKKNKYKVVFASKQENVANLRAECGELERTLRQSNEAQSRQKKELLQVVEQLAGVKQKITRNECEIEKQLEIRNSLLKKCRLEEIDLPLRRGNLNDISVDNSDSSKAAEIVVDFSVLGREAKGRGEGSYESVYIEKIKRVQEEIDKLVPNLRALDKLESTEARLKATMESFETARMKAKKAQEEFSTVKSQRMKLFNRAFKHISEKIDPIYKQLTKSLSVPTGGTAYLSLENSEESYLEGIKFHAMPPMKRFLDMEQLSGGEKTVAALALLFAIHSFRPAPFFILDEVDAALDNANVQRVASFIKNYNRENPEKVQFIVISLKASLYEKAESLIGIYRDPEGKGSQVLTLNLSEYQE